VSVITFDAKTIWMKSSELARYQAARELTNKSVGMTDIVILAVLSRALLI
jgi:hypothetical protein